MSDNSPKAWLKRIRQAVFTVVVMAAGVRMAWALVAPVMPELVTLAIVLTVLGIAIFGWHSK